MPKNRSASARDWLFVVGLIAAVTDIGVGAVFDSSLIVRATAFFALVALSCGVGTVFGRRQERRRNSQGAPVPYISA